MIILVGDYDTLPTVDGDAGRTIELAGTGSRTSESSDERAVLAIDLYTIVGSIGDNDVTSPVACHAPWPADIVGNVSAITDDLHHLVRLVVPNSYGIVVIRYRTGAHDWFRRSPSRERDSVRLRRVGAVDRATLPDRTWIGRLDITQGGDRMPQIVPGSRKRDPILLPGRSMTSILLDLENLRSVSFFLQLKYATFISRLRDTKDVRIEIRKLYISN